MNLKAFFIIRFLTIATILAISYYFIFMNNLVAANIQLPTLLLVAGVSTVAIMLGSYHSLKAEPKEETDHICREEDFSWDKVAGEDSDPLDNPTSEKIGSSEIREVENKSLVSLAKNNPKAPTKSDIKRAIKTRTLNAIQTAPITVKAVLQKDGEGDWDITEFESKIESAEGKTQVPKKPSSPRISRSRG